MRTRHLRQHAKHIGVTPNSLNYVLLDVERRFLVKNIKVY